MRGLPGKIHHARHRRDVRCRKGARAGEPGSPEVFLGLGPEIAVSRRPGAHAQEPASERIDQVDYDIRYSRQLRDMGVRIDSDRPHKERTELAKLGPMEPTFAAYDGDRIAELRIRQDFVLDKMRQQGIVIETRPTSNLRIGGIPAVEHHPSRKFYDTGQRAAICTDDPGILNTSLSDEIDLIARSFRLDHDELVQRIGDPHEYRLGKSRARQVR